MMLGKEPDVLKKKMNEIIDLAEDNTPVKALKGKTRKKEVSTILLYFSDIAMKFRIYKLKKGLGCRKLTRKALTALTAGHCGLIINTD